MKKSTIILLLFSILLVIMAITVPEKNDHISVIKEKIKSKAGKSNLEDIPLLDVLYSGIQDLYIDQELKKFKHKNYVILSIGEIDSTAISIGVLGNVFMTDDFKKEEEKENYEVK